MDIKELNIEKLIEKLEELRNSNCKCVQCNNLNIYDSNEIIISEINNLACWCLINNKGKYNWDNITKIEELGYKVVFEEKYGSGWITGIIYFPNGKCVVFG